MNKGKEKEKSVFKLHYTHNYGKYTDVEISSIEDLKKLVKKEKCGIIINYYGEDYWRDECKGQWVLEVYDDYRE